MIIQIHPSRFNDAFRPYLHDDTPLQLYMGGGGSGKSVFIAQRLHLDLCAGDRNYIVCRKVAATLYDSVYSEIRKSIYSFGAEYAAQFEMLKSPLRITHKRSRRSAVFVGLDDVEKVKSITPESGVFTDVWAEEATECTESDIDQLTIRLRGQSPVVKRVTLTFNPVHNRHWIAERHCAGFADDAQVYRDEGKLILRTTYRDNRFLAPDDIAKIERYRDSNPRFYRVYGQGLWGTLGDVIFENVTVEDLSGQQFGQKYYGVDFGFANDPTAIVECAVRGDDVYIIREHVRGGMSNREIHAIAGPMAGRAPITCDCAEPKSISELRGMGLHTIPCSKGADSVLHGVQWLLDKRIHIDKSCTTCAHEFSVYEWDKDRDGRPINRPVDRDNHTIDAIRYALESLINAKPPAATYRNPLRG